MASVNKVILIGNVGQDPVFTERANNFVTASFSLATTKSWRDRSSNERRERTDWHRVEVSGKLAEIVRDIIGQGDQVYVEGELNTDRVEREPGKFEYFTKIRAEQVQKLGKRDRNAGGNDDHQESGSDDVGGHGGDDGGGSQGGGAPAASAPAAAAPAAPAAAAPVATPSGTAASKAAPRGRTFGKKD